MQAKADGETKPHQFFYDLFPATKALGIEQIALGGGEPSLFPDFVETFCAKAREQDIIVNMTSNGDGLTPETMPKFAGLTMISISMDRFKVKQPEDVKWIFSKMDLVRDSGLKVGCNLQLDPFLIDNLYPMLAKILEHADYVYLLQTKPSNIKVNEDLKKRLLGVTLAFGRVFVDDSIQLGLERKEGCSRGTEIVSIDHAGRAYKCSFDEPFAQLENGGDLVELVEKEYPFELTTECPFL